MLLDSVLHAQIELEGAAQVRPARAFTLQRKTNAGKMSRKRKGRISPQSLHRSATSAPNGEEVSNIGDECTIASRCGEERLIEAAKRDLRTLDGVHHRGMARHRSLKK